MTIKVKLADIITGMEFQTDESRSYLDKNAGEVVTISDEELRAAENNEPVERFPEWQRKSIEIAKEILETDSYIPLPGKFDIHEYNIMEKFCLSIENEEIRNTLYYTP